MFCFPLGVLEFFLLLLFVSKFFPHGQVVLCTVFMVFPLPQTLVKTLDKNLVKHLVKHLSENGGV